jgi:hypothetical protein
MNKVPKTTTLATPAKAFTLYKLSEPAVTVATPVKVFAPYRDQAPLFNLEKAVFPPTESGITG